MEKGEGMAGGNRKKKRPGDLEAGPLAGHRHASPKLLYPVSVTFSRGVRFSHPVSAAPSGNDKAPGAEGEGIRPPALSHDPERAGLFGAGDHVPTSHPRIIEF